MYPVTDLIDANDATLHASPARRPPVTGTEALNGAGITVREPLPYYEPIEFNQNPPPPVTADPSTYINSRTQRLRFELTRDQMEVDRADQTGPGFVGFYNDIRAMLAAQCIPVPLVRTPAGWQRSYDAGLIAVVNSIRHTQRSQEYLMYRCFRFRSSIGEHAWWPTTGPFGDIRFGVAHPMALSMVPNRPDTFGVKLRPNAMPGSTDFVELPAQNLRRMHNPGDVWEGEAKVDLARILPEIRTSRSSMRNVLSAVDSRLLMNGLLFISTGGDSAEQLEAEHLTGGMSLPHVNTFDNSYGPNNQMLPASPSSTGGVNKIATDVVRFAGRAFRDTNGSDPASRVFYPFLHHTKPEMVDVGRAVDEETLATLAAMVIQAGQGLKVPIQFLVAGEASQTYWNSTELRSALHDHGVYPSMGEVLDDWTRFAYRPILAFTPAGRRAIGDGNPEDHAIGFDCSPLEVKPNDFKTMLDAYKVLGVKRQVVADRFSLTADDLIPATDQFDDLAFWAAVSGAKANETGLQPPPADGLPRTTDADTVAQRARNARAFAAIGRDL